MKNALDVLIRENAEAAKQEVIEHYSSYDLLTLITPYGYKNLFGICAEILSQLPDDVFDAVAVESMKWLQDLNWPGCDLIESKLRKLPTRRLQQIIDSAIAEARQAHDDEWVFNISEVFSDYCA